MREVLKRVKEHPTSRYQRMPLGKSRKKTSEFFSRTVKSLKSIFHHGRRNNDAAAPHPCNPFSCSSRKIISKDACVGNEYYSERWTNEYDHGSHLSAIATTDKVIVVSTKEHNVGLMSNQCFKKDENRPKETKKMDQKEDGCLKKQGSYRLSQRMKELEMMEFKDVDHVLDVEEVLHYYSRLKSPVYLDIVDSFFTDMYAELHKPHRSKVTSLHGSQRRLGPVKL